MDKIRLGISACLLGEKVRFDGGHKRDSFLVDTLGAYVEYLPVCPEVEMGLPTPRQALRLVGDPQDPHLVFSRSGEDVTAEMTNWAEKRLGELAHEGLCGFIFKSRSPSSGMERVKLYDRNGVPKKEGVGLFARAFMERFPLLPVEEDGRLHDPRLRENFIEAIFVFRRWRELVAAEGTPGGVVEFHSRHKLMILARSTVLYREMGALVARAGSLSREDLRQQYLALLMRALRLQTTVKKNVNVLMHILGYFKKRLSADEKSEMLQIVDDYHRGLLPLIVPVTLLNHYVRKYEEPYLAKQYYLNPHPLELQLRNHV